MPYMQAFGHVVIAWMWLELALAAIATKSEAARAGLMGAKTYFYHYELPKIDAWLAVVSSREALCRDMQDGWF